MHRQSEKLVKQQYLPHMPLQYGELRPTSDWDRLVSLGHPSKFQRVSRLGSVTARHSTSGRQPNLKLRRWTEGATCIRQGGHHVGHWPTFLVSSFFIVFPSQLHAVDKAHQHLGQVTCILSIILYYTFTNNAINLNQISPVQKIKKMYCSNQWQIGYQPV